MRQTSSINDCTDKLFEKTLLKLNNFKDGLPDANEQALHSLLEPLYQVGDSEGQRHGGQDRVQADEKGV